MSFSALRRCAVLMSALALASCATLPSSGPTGHEIRRAIDDPIGGGPLQIVEVADITLVPVSADVAVNPLVDVNAPPTDMVGPGDVLDISIYEVGVALFGSAPTATGGFDASARAEKLPPARIDDNGNIQLPYTGRLHVAGLTLADIAAQIRRSLRAISQDPQVLVSLREAITNSVIVGGEVTRPGRLVLPTNRETLSDAIALAGGYRGNARDLAVRVTRQGTTSEFRLSAILTGSERDARAYPGDRIAILSAPRSFSVMGAPGRVEQLPFSAASVSLAEAIASAGGANPGLGDAQAIFVFRIVPDDTGKERGIVYHVNMMKTGGFLIAQRFAMRDKDVLYIGNARANQPSKLIQIISQLFAPIVTVTSAVQVLRTN
jgi:polysaccharide export outer membrane protein